MRKCLNCNKSFEIPTGKPGPKRLKYCSQKCTYTFRNKKRSFGREKKCPMCSLFFTDRSRNNNRVYCHGKCSELRGAHLKYGITLQQYEKLDFNNGCQICTGKQDLCIDHCHDTGNIRGVLCRACNTAIGSLSDCVQTLQNAIKYLETSREGNK